MKVQDCRTKKGLNVLKKVFMYTVLNKQWNKDVFFSKLIHLSSAAVRNKNETIIKDFDGCDS